MITPSIPLVKPDPRNRSESEPNSDPEPRQNSPVWSVASASGSRVLHKSAIRSTEIQTESSQNAQSVLESHPAAGTPPTWTRC